MKPFNLEEYSQLCADLLEFKYKNQAKYWMIYPLSDNSFFGKNRRYIAVNNFQFHSDWNWIMEVVEKIKTLKCVRDITIASTGVMLYVDEMDRHFFPFEKDIKEAVVQAIWEFLNWYKENKSS